MMMISTKSDLELDRKVESYEAVELASMWDIPYIETSAKENINVEKAFMLLLHEIGIFLQQNPQEGPQPKEKNKCILM